MGAKGDASRARILKAARTLFATRGFSRVTMGDVCQATGLSRGGLYRHFCSTDAIFSAILNEEQTRAEAALAHAKANAIPTTRIVSTFLRSRIRYMIDPAAACDLAVFEFAANSAEGKALLAARAQHAVETLTALIEDGCETGAYRVDDPKAVALHILCTLEGVGRHNALTPLSDDEIEAQLALFEAILRG